MIFIIMVLCCLSLLPYSTSVLPDHPCTYYLSHISHDLIGRASYITTNKSLPCVYNSSHVSLSSPSWLLADCGAAYLLSTAQQPQA